jgi:hypothetical protein
VLNNDISLVCRRLLHILGMYTIQTLLVNSNKKSTLLLVYRVGKEAQRTNNQSARCSKIVKVVGRQRTGHASYQQRRNETFY